VRIIKNTAKTPKKEGFIRFVCLSDTHQNDKCFENVPDGDVLLHAGDFTFYGSPKETEKFVE
jgi:predicted phosphodiesterase